MLQIIRAWNKENLFTYIQNRASDLKYIDEELLIMASFAILLTFGGKIKKAFCMFQDQIRHYLLMSCW